MDCKCLQLRLLRRFIYTMLESLFSLKTQALRTQLHHSQCRQSLVEVLTFPTCRRAHDFLWYEPLWDGHSCPSPLILILVLILVLVSTFGIRCHFNTKVKSDGQECPSHTLLSNYPLASL